MRSTPSFPAPSPPPPRNIVSFPQPLLMGVVNATPDSFYAGSRALSSDEVVRRGLELAEEGADWLDIGGESTRPGSDPVSMEEECRRILPAIEGLARRCGVPVSVDTSKATVARRARDAGATILNDISALRSDPEMPQAALGFNKVILMHMQGIPKTMQEDPRYGNVVRDILGFFRDRLQAFERAGGDASKVWLDPGIGFGKDLEHNLDILHRLEELRSSGRPLVLGVSRKSFLGRLLGSSGSPLSPEDRLEGSLAAACRAAQAGVEVLRVHDVRATKRALVVFSATLASSLPSRADSVALARRAGRA